MYFWYGNNDGSSRSYGAELGFYELNANQIKNYVVDNDPNIELIKRSLFENIDEAEEEEEESAGNNECGMGTISPSLRDYFYLCSNTCGLPFVGGRHYLGS